MGGYQMELNYRLGPGFGAVEWSRLVNLVLAQMGFDDETHFELVLERNNGERQAFELMAGEFAHYLNPGVWPDLHQVILSNQWIKDMNVKLHLVKRGDHATISVKLDLAENGRRRQLAAAIQSLLAGSEAEEAFAPYHQERERLFGALLLTASGANKTRSSFLAGDFRAALSAGWALLQDRLKGVLPYRPGLEHRILEFLKQDPPTMLFPNLAGPQLRQELDGLAHLLTGFLTLLRPVVEGKDKQSEDPAVVLKCLVLLSLLVERIEAMVPNPMTAKKKDKTPAKPAVSRSKAAKKTTSRPKAVKKVVNKTGGKAAPSAKAKALRSPKPEKPASGAKKPLKKSSR